MWFLWLFLSIYISIFHSVATDSPENVTAIAVSSTSITVIWNAVSFSANITNTTEVTVYEVRYDPLETFGGLISTQTNVSESELVVLSNLEEYVQYEISVRAYTETGWGPYSDAINITTLQNGKCKILVNFTQS